MEDKKLDLNSIIGFVLIFGILIWMMYQNQPTEKEIAAKKAKKELVVAAEKSKQVVAMWSSTLAKAVSMDDAQKDSMHSSHLLPQQFQCSKSQTWSDTRTQRSDERPGEAAR